MNFCPKNKGMDHGRRGLFFSHFGQVGGPMIIQDRDEPNLARSWSHRKVEKF